MRKRIIFSVIGIGAITLFFITVGYSLHFVDGFKPSNAPKTETDAQKSDNTIKLSEYTNSEEEYKISYPSDAKIVAAMSLFTITDKKGEWEFKVWTPHYNNYSSLEEHVNYETQALTNSGYKILEKKPLTVGGFPAIMISSLTDETGKGKLSTLFSSLTDETGKGKLKFFEIVTHPNNIAYEFYVSTPADKFDQYADLFFKILKSFQLTNISGNDQVVMNGTLVIKME